LPETYWTVREKWETRTDLAEIPDKARRATESQANSKISVDFVQAIVIQFSHGCYDSFGVASHHPPCFSPHDPRQDKLAMSDPVAAAPNLSEFQINLVKDGGRRVMYGGDPYEDDVEPDQPSGGSGSVSSTSPGGTP
jgi:hypothetical protein